LFENNLAVLKFGTWKIFERAEVQNFQYFNYQEKHNNKI